MPRNPFKVENPPGSKAAATKDSRLVGAAVPRQLAEEVAIYSISAGIYMSDLVREAIENYMKQAKKDWTVRRGMNLLTKRAQIEWERRKEEAEGLKNWNKKEAFEQYQQEMIGKLKARGILPSRAKKIVSGVKI